MIPKLTADEAQLNQILLNLLSNSIKYAPNGVIKVTAELEEGGGVSSTFLIQGTVLLKKI